MDAKRWQQVRAEFEALVELDRNEWPARIEALGATDPELRRVWSRCSPPMPPPRCG